MKKAWKSKLFMIVCVLVSLNMANALKLKAQATFEKNINLAEIEYTGLACDIITAENKLFVHTGSSVIVYQALADSNFAHIKTINLLEGDPFGKFAPIFFYDRLNVDDKNLMAYNSNDKLLYVVAPDLSIQVIDVEANNENLGIVFQWERPLETANSPNINHLTPLHGICIIKYDNIHNRLYWIVGGRDITKDPDVGLFHYRDVYFSVSKISLSGTTRNIIYDELYHLNDEPGNSYTNAIMDVEYNEVFDVFYLARNQRIELYEVISDTTVSFITNKTIYTDFYKAGKLLYINDSAHNVHKIIALPYRSPAGIDPQGPVSFYEIDGGDPNSSNWNYMAIPSPHRRILDAEFLPGNSDLVLCYTNDNETNPNTNNFNTDIAIYSFNSASNHFNSEATYMNTNGNTTYSNPLSLDRPFKILANNTMALVSKKDGIVNIEKQQDGTYTYTTLLDSKSNFFYSGVMSSGHYFVLNLVKNGIDIFDQNFTHVKSITSGIPVYHITANPNDRKLFFYNTLNAHQTGIFIYGMDNDNDPTVFIGLQSPVGEVVHNPFTNQMLISQNSEAIPARVKVLNNALVFENDIELSGVSHATNMYIAENGLLYIAANMYDNTPKIFVLDAQTYQPVSGSPFEVSGLIPASGYYDIFSADFCYNPYNQKVYATFTTNNTTVPSDIESYNSLDPYFSALNSSLLSASPTTTFPGILVDISEEGISTLLSNLNGPRELLCATPTNTSGSNQGFLYLNAADLIRYDCQTGNTLYFAGLDLNDITYNSNQNCLYGFRDTYVGEGNPLDEHPSHRLTEVYRVQDGQGTSTLLYTYDGQSASLVSNPYDGMLYLQTKVDADRLGAQPMQVIRLQPDQVNQEPPPVSLHHRGFCPELDINLDFHYANYNLTTPYIDPYTNRMYLPNGGHSSVSVVEFEPNEKLPLNNQEYDWLSFPRLTRTANNAVPVNEVLEGNIHPEDYESQSKLLNVPPGGETEINSVFSGLEWSTTGDLSHIQSTRGYKLHLKYDSTNAYPDQRWLEMQGTVVDPSTPLPLYMGKENWVGYFLYKQQNIMDALGSTLYSLDWVKGEGWFCWYAGPQRNPNNPVAVTEGWLCDNKVHNISYGQMVVLKAGYFDPSPIAFTWQGVGRSIVDSPKAEAEFFTYAETADYTPVVVVLDTTETISEIGVFVNDSCVGATTVLPEDTLVGIRAYLDGQSGDSLVFETYSNTKSTAKETIRSYYVFDSQRRRYLHRSIHTGEHQGLYQISLKSQPQTEKLFSGLLGNFWVYPNPAREQLMIVYELENETPVTLEAYDLYGRKVASLMQGVQSSGTRTFTWNLTSALGQRLNSGIYTITLKAGTESLTKKVVIN